MNGRTNANSNLNKIKMGEISSSMENTVDCGFKPDVVFIHAINAYNDYQWDCTYNGNEFTSWVNNSGQGGKGNSSSIEITDNGFTYNFSTSISGYYIAIKS